MANYLESILHSAPSAYIRMAFATGALVAMGAVMAACGNATPVQPTASPTQYASATSTQAQATSTPLPATATALPATAVPSSTSTSTATAVPPTPIPPTSTPVPPTATNVPATVTPSATAYATAVARGINELVSDTELKDAKSWQLVHPVYKSSMMPGFSPALVGGQYGYYSYFVKAGSPIFSPIDGVVLKIISGTSYNIAVSNSAGGITAYLSFYKQDASLAPGITEGITLKRGEAVAIVGVPAPNVNNLSLVMRLFSADLSKAGDVSDLDKWVGTLPGYLK